MIKDYYKFITNIEEITVFLSYVFNVFPDSVGTILTPWNFTVLSVTVVTIVLEELLVTWLMKINYSIALSVPVRKAVIDFLECFKLFYFDMGIFAGHNFYL